MSEAVELVEASAGALDESAARAVTEQIRSAVVRTLDVLGEIDQLVGRAYAGRAWVVLGYATWAAYCEVEFSGARLWTSVDERQAATLRLREAGLSQRAAAAVLGVSDGTVRRDEQAAGERASSASDGAVDAAGTAVSVSRSLGLDGRVRPASRPSSVQVLERQSRVSGLHRDGRTQVEIAAELGISQSTVSMYLAAATAGGDEPEVVEDAPVALLAESLLVEAESRVAVLASAARAVRELVVDADEWVTDVLFAADAADVLTDRCRQAARDLAYVLPHLSVDVPPTSGPVDADRPLERARAARRVWAGLHAGETPDRVATRLELPPQEVAALARAVQELPPQRQRWHYEHKAAVRDQTTTTEGNDQ